ncbi:MAG: hypothetical protein RQ745_07115 [Longimicrobiales bacterium]|nr:hypothetical protein [Longimicrobiales bacterium]
MGNKLITALAFVTFVHLGARTAAPASLTYVSGFATPAELPEELRELSAEGVSCTLLIAFDPTCPACDRAAREQAAANEGGLALDVVWMAETSAAAEEFAGRVHDDARVVAAPGGADLLDVDAVPAAFVIAGDVVVHTSPITGQEDLGTVAQRCIRPQLTE